MYFRDVPLNANLEHPTLHAEDPSKTISYVLLTLQEMFINGELSDSLKMQNFCSSVLVDILIFPNTRHYKLSYSNTEDGAKTRGI